MDKTQLGILQKLFFQEKQIDFGEFPGFQQLNSAWRGILEVGTNIQKSEQDWTGQMEKRIHH